jgi:hypothetical protein
MFGPCVHPVPLLEVLSFSNQPLRDIVLGADPLPSLRATVWVDGRDVLVHVEALSYPEVGGRRYHPTAPASEKFAYQRVVDIIRKEFPEQALDVVIKGDEDAPIPDFYDVDGETTSRELGINYRLFKESVVDTVAQIREMVVRDNK